MVMSFHRTLRLLWRRRLPRKLWGRGVLLLLLVVGWNRRCNPTTATASSYMATTTAVTEEKPHEQPLQASPPPLLQNTRRTASLSSSSAAAQRNQNNIQLRPRLREWRPVGPGVAGAVMGDQFGFAVALSADGTVFAVGSNMYHHKTGQVSVYQYNHANVGDAWTRWGAPIDGAAAGDAWGSSVALSANGRVLAAGAVYHHSPEIGNAAGHVRVLDFHESLEEWLPRGEEIVGVGPYSYFGKSVALSSNGERVAGGGYAFSGSPAGRRAGVVRVLEWDGDLEQWLALGQDLYGRAERDNFGMCVALSGDGTVVAAGAPRGLNLALQRTNTGHVRVFAYNSTHHSWNQWGQDLEGQAAGDEFGFAVAVASSDGRTVAVGAYKHDAHRLTDTGQVRVFQWNSLEQQWTQLGQDLYGDYTMDYLGQSVELAADGRTVAVSVPRWDSYFITNHTYASETFDHGQVRVLSYNASSLQWDLVDRGINGQGRQDYFGGLIGRQAVALSADGTVVAAGAPGQNDTAEPSPGYVRVFTTRHQLL